MHHMMESAAAGPVTYVIPGFGARSEQSAARLKRRLAAQLAQPGDINVWLWSERRPGLATAGGATGGAALAKLLGVGGWGAAGIAALGALAGVGKSYAGARSDVDDAVAALADEFIATARTRQVNVIALSLGTEVALRVLDRLAVRNVSIGGFLLLIGGTAERSDRWSRAVRVPCMGVGNIYNPADGPLLADKTARGADTVGHGPLQLPGVQNFKTRYGHFEQIDHLAEILGMGEEPAVRLA